MSDIPPLVQGPQAPVAAVIGNANDAGNGVVAAAPAENGQPQNGEAAVPQPPNAPLAIDEEVIDRAKLKSLVWKHFKKIKVNNVWKAKSHYIDNSWMLRSHMLRFIDVPAPHSSDRLAAVLVNCMLDWNIDTKVSTITLDNYSTNDAMIAKLKKKLVLPYLLREGAFLHMRCSAHILNLIVKDWLVVVKDGIETIRDSVAYWLATPKRLEFFQETCKQLRVPCERRLVLDCPTRWNSTFLMLVTAIPYKEVFNRLKQCDPQYDSLPSIEHWLFASIVCEKFNCFSLVSDLFLGSKYPTENLFVPSICELRIQIYQWMMDSNEFIQRMAASMWTKFIKYWQVIQDLLAIAVVLDPRYKLDIIEYYTERIAMDGSLLNANTIRGILGDLLVEYQVKMNVNNAPTICNHMAGSSSTSDQGFDLFVSQRKRYRTSSVTAELDNYLNEDILPRQPDFDILMWWKVNGPKYPILQNVAKDILALLVTSVASESAFSSGGRVLDPHRSRLHESTVEALMCTRSWLQSNGKYCHNFTSTVLVQLILLYCSYFSS
ncbi:Putative AC transposase [Linum grandiflorum]